MEDRAEAGKTGAFERVIRLVSWFLILLPPVLAGLFVRAFGVNVIVGDAWSLGRLFNRWSDGTLSVWDFFRQHNEHRMFFPKGFEFLLAGVTNYDNLIEMYVVLICFLATLIILFLAFRGSVGSSWLFLFVPVSLLIFSLRQYENLLFGFQINFAFTQTFGVLALFLLYVLAHTRYRKTVFVAALASATVASLSTVQGLFVWPAGLLLLSIGQVEGPAKRFWIFFWGLAGLAEWVAYFSIGYRFEGDSSLLYALTHPAVGIEYYLNLLGSALFWERVPAFVSGLLLVCLALVILFMIYRDGKLGEHSFWVSLLLFSLLMLAVITLGRSGVFGALQALAPRYTSFSVLAVVSVYAMLVKVAFERRSVANAVLLVALSGVVLSSAAVSYPRGIEAGSEERAVREKAAFVLSTYESQPDEALTERLNPRASTIRERAPVLQELGYNVFSGSRVPGSPPPLSDLSPAASPIPSAAIITGPGVNQQGSTIIVPDEEGSYIRVVGWAVDAENESLAGGAYVEVDGEPFPAFYGVDRQEVVDAFGVASYRYSGFERAIPVSEIGAGPHELSVVIVTGDGEGYYRSDQKAAFEVV